VTATRFTDFSCFDLKPVRPAVGLSVRVPAVLRVPADRFFAAKGDVGNWVIVAFLSRREMPSFSKLIRASLKMTGSAPP
jgi:hypothetical protein